MFIELEMIELTEDKIYRVKNFAKHQNIKVKEKIEAKGKEENIENKEVQVNEIFKNEMPDNKDKESEEKISENATNDEISNLEITNKDINIIHDNISDKKINNSQSNIPILLEMKQNKRGNNKKKEGNFECIDENGEDNTIACFYDGDEGRTLRKGERVTKAWSF